MLVESQNDSALLCTLFGFGSAAEQHDLCKTPVTEIEKEPKLSEFICATESPELEVGSPSTHMGSTLTY